MEDDERCGKSKEPIQPFNPKHPMYFSRKICKVCGPGGVCHFKVNNVPDCPADDTPEAYRCLIDRAVAKYTSMGAQADETRFEDGVHSGTTSDNPVSGCSDLGSTRDTCFPVSHSFHYCGRAVDFHMDDYCMELADKIAAEIMSSRNFAVASVHNPFQTGADGEHIHAQFKPREFVICRAGEVCDDTTAHPCKHCNWLPVNGAAPSNSCGTAVLGGATKYLDCGGSCPPAAPEAWTFPQ